MAARLVSRQKWLPGGFRFFQPELNWRAQRNVSFDQIVQALIRARLANPAQLKKHGWSTEYNAVANEVDEYNAKICQAHGWHDYVAQPIHGASPKLNPRDQANLLQSLKDAAARAREMVSGARTLLEWKDSGQGAVPAELSEHRAIVCSTCPINEPGDFTKWFTTPAAELIKRQIEEAQARKLTTARDDQLHLCTACHCPLKLKVHVPIDWIAKRIPGEQIERLRKAPSCWILAELDRA